MKTISILSVLVGITGLLLFGGPTGEVLADGTETLGSPSIPISQGTNVVAAGVGLAQSQPGDIEITVPAGAAVTQVLLYWEGFMATNVAGDDTIIVNGNSVTGTLIGGQAFFFGGAYSSAFRADITSLGLVGPGTSTLTVGDLVFSDVSNGAGVVVIYDDGSGITDIDIRDGLDLAFINFPEPRKSTIAQTFDFASSPADRVGTLAMFFSSVSGTASSGGPLRPSSIDITVDGTTTTFSNQLDSNDGDEWDTVNASVTIPAGASSLTVQAFSRDDFGDGQDPLAASFTWTAAAFSIQGCSIGDYVWEDANRDGCQDGEEDGINGVTVELYENCNFIGDPITFETITKDGQDGFYEFKNLVCGQQYGIRFVNPNDIYAQTEPNSCPNPIDNDDTKDSDCGDDGRVCATAGDEDAAPGSDNPTIDCGYVCEGKIGDYVWLDENEDGCQDEVNTGIAGVDVTLSEDCVDRENPQTVQTNADGFYEFAGLCPGEYFVEFGNGRPNTDPGQVCDGDPDVSDEKDSNCGDEALQCVELTPNNPENPTIDCGKVGPCLELEKLVSGDGGVTFFDADNCSDADVPFTVDDAVYKLIVTNCGKEAVTLDKIVDLDLGINLPLNPTVTIQPGDSVEFNNDAGQTQGLLEKEGACPDPDGEFDNTATVSGMGAGSNLPVEATDPACVKCGPCVDLLKEVSVDGGQTWSDANAPDCSDGPGTSDPAEYRLTIENCGGETLVDVVIDDDVLGIDNVPVASTLPIGGSIILTKDNIPQLGQDDLCPLTPGDPGVTGNILRNIASVVAAGDPSGIPVSDADPACVKCEEECLLTIDKECRVETPPTEPFDKCDGKLQQFTVIWTGGPIVVSGPSNDAVNGQVKNGQEVTFFGPFASNDVIVDLAGATPDQSKFHVSCSDPDFNSPDDCGKPAGNGKSDDDNFNDGWLLEGFIDKNGLELDCNPSNGDGGFSQNCEFEKQLVNCETFGKPNSLTFRYEGGGAVTECTDNAASRAGEKEPTCSGNLPVGAEVMIFVDSGSADQEMVAPDAEFTITDFGSNTVITLIDNDGFTEVDEFHTSCSAPLELGDVFGNLVLVGWDGARGSADVTYRYVVTNLGDPLTQVSVTDSILGDIGTIASLSTGDSEPLESETAISDTTTNTAQAIGILESGAECKSNTDSVTVTAKEPTCEVSIQLDKIEDKKIKWKLSNPSNVAATIETLTITWPGDGNLEKVKYDGNDILKDVSLPPPTATITSDQWLKEPKDRTVKAGDSGKKLEFEFDANFPDKKEQSPDDFTLKVTFEQGCEVSFN